MTTTTTTYTVTVDSLNARSVVAHYDDINEASDHFGRARRRATWGTLITLWENDTPIDTHTEL